MNTRMSIEKTETGMQLVTIEPLIDDNLERINIAVLLKLDPHRSVHQTQVQAVRRAHELLSVWLTHAGD